MGENEKIDVIAELEAVSPRAATQVIANPTPGTVTLRPFPTTDISLEVVGNQNQAGPLAAFTDYQGYPGLVINTTGITFPDGTTQSTAGGGGGGGGGTPGGAVNTLQYNSAGAFGGVTGSSVAANGAVTIVGDNINGQGPLILNQNVVANHDYLTFQNMGGTKWEFYPQTVNDLAIWSSITGKAALYLASAPAVGIGAAPAAGYDLDVTASAANGGMGHFAKQVVIDSTLDGALTINQNTVSNAWLRLTQSGAHLWEAYLKTTDLSFYSVDSHADVLLIDPHGVGIGNIPAAGYDLDVTSSAANGGTAHFAKTVTIESTGTTNLFSLKNGGVEKFQVYYASGLRFWSDLVGGDVLELVDSGLSAGQIFIPKALLVGTTASAGTIFELDNAGAGNNAFSMKSPSNTWDLYQGAYGSVSANGLGFYSQTGTATAFWLEPTGANTLTPAPGDNSTKVATTAFVQGVLGGTTGTPAATNTVLAGPISPAAANYSNTNSSSSGATQPTSITCAFPNTNKAGNLLLVVLSSLNAKITATSVSDTQGNTWSYVFTPQSSYNMNMAYCTAIGGTAPTVTFTAASADYLSMAIMEVSGQAASPIDAPASSMNNTAANVPLSIATPSAVATATEMILAFATYSGSVTKAIPGTGVTNWASPGAGSGASCFAFVQNTVTGLSGVQTITSTFDDAPGAGRGVMIVSIKLSSATGTAPPTMRSLIGADLPAVVGRVLTIFTSQTYTPTAGTKALYVEAVGGGGGGGGIPATSAQGAFAGGGASGSYAASFISNPAASYTVTIGAGGTAGTTAPSAGGNGGTTTFGSISAPGGNGGGVATAGTGMLTAAGGPAGASGTGDVGVGGNPGGTAVGNGSAGAYWGCGGAGGMSPLLPSTTPQAQWRAATAVLAGVGGGPGCGGSGAMGTGTQVATAGGAGGAGFVRVLEFF